MRVSGSMSSKAFLVSKKRTAVKKHLAKLEFISDREIVLAESGFAETELRGRKFEFVFQPPCETRV